MNELQLYVFNGNDVRIFINDKKEPEFCANDITNILGYVNGRDAVLRHCKPEGVVKRDTPTSSGIQNISYLSEGNLYRLIIKSDMPLAAPFESWVCDKVLPEIRKSGSYGKIVPKTYGEALRLAADEYDKRMLAENKVLELSPKAEIYENIVNADNNLRLNEAAKVIGIGRNKMMESLRSQKILFENNTPYQCFINEGYFIVKVHPVKMGRTIENYPQTYVTGKGLTWLSKRLNHV